jgi:hypothetical protein
VQKTQQAGSNQRGGARVLTIFGWLTIATTVAVVGFGLTWYLSTLWIVFQYDYVALTASSLEALTIASFGIAIGLALLMIAGTFRSDARPGRFKLWAKLLLLAAAELCLAIPLFFYSVGLMIRALAHDPSTYPVDLLARDLVATAATAGSTPFLAGIIMLATALIWGRRKSGPDIPAVFS